MTEKVPSSLPTVVTTHRYRCHTRHDLLLEIEHMQSELSNTVSVLNKYKDSASDAPVGYTVKKIMDEIEALCKED